jgi:hypothetical protein
VLKGYLPKQLATCSESLQRPHELIPGTPASAANQPTLPSAQPSPAPHPHHPCAPSACAPSITYALLAVCRSETHLAWMAASASGLMGISLLVPCGD